MMISLTHKSKQRAHSTAQAAAVLAVVLTAAPVPAQPGGEKPPGPPPQLVRLAEVQSEQLQRRWELIGRLLETNRVTVAAEQSGRLVDVTIEVGQPVRGSESRLIQVEDTFAELELAGARAALGQAQAQVVEAQANLEQAERDLKYYEDLSKTGTTNRKELDDARTERRAAQARLERANAAVVEGNVRIDEAKTKLEKLTVYAPFDGVIVKKLAEVGQWVQPGTPVAEIVSRGQIDALVDVPERLVPLVEVGKPLEVVIEPLAMNVTGKVRALIPLGSTAARTFPMKVRMDDQEGKLMSGMSVLAKLPTQEKEQALTVPRDAVIRTPTGAVVWANAEGKAVRINIEVLFSHGDRYAVRESATNAGPPLREGLEVVIEGGERLMFPGQPLIIAGDKRAATE